MAHDRCRIIHPGETKGQRQLAFLRWGWKLANSFERRSYDRLYCRVGRERRRKFGTWVETIYSVPDFRHC